MSLKLTRWSLSLVAVATLALGLVVLIDVPESYSLPNCRCPSAIPFSTIKGWGKATDCATAEQRAVADAQNNAQGACFPDGVCAFDPDYTITGACHSIGGGMVQVDVEIGYKCFICLDEPTL